MEMRQGGSIHVRMLGPLCQAAGGSRETELPVARRCTVHQALGRLVAAYPRLGDQLYGEDQRLAFGLNLFVGGRSIRLLDGLDTRLRQGDELLLVPLLGGG